MAILAGLFRPRPLSSSLAGGKTGAIRRTCAVFGVLALVCSLAAQGIFREYDLKALFLYNFPQFIEWAPEAFVTPDAPVIVGIFGQERVAKALDDLTRNESGRRRKMIVQRYRKLAEVPNCHILFIDQSQNSAWTNIVEKVHGKPILTVSDIDGFTGRGGMIQFITEDKKIRLRINVSQAKAANLSISSKLLKLAEIEENIGK